MRRSVIALASILAASSALAEAVAPTPVIEVGRDYGVLQPLLMAVATAACTVVTAAAGVLALWLKKKLNLTDAEAQSVGLDIDAKHRDALQTALTNAAGLALNKLGNDLRGRTIDPGNAAVAQAVESVFRSAPDAIAYFGLERRAGDVAQKIVAKLPQIANATTSPAPTPGAATGA